MSSGIFGIFHRDGAPVDPGDLRILSRFTGTSDTTGGVWGQGAVAFGQTHTFGECSADWRPSFDPVSGIRVVASGRIDNIPDLVRELDLRRGTIGPGPPDVILRAYLRWGDDCVTRIYGDWSFAAWDARANKLFLARDQFGNTALYYYIDPRVCVFSSDQRSLLGLPWVPVKLDELYLGQVVMSWPAYHGDRTIHTHLKRLPPAHRLAVSPERCHVSSYWRLEETPELHLRHKQDYVEAFREVFDEAVRARIVPSLVYGPGIAAQLSGGLDSSAVTATAAACLQSQGKRLAAFTSTPVGDTSPFFGSAFGDEFPLAQLVARGLGNVDHHAVDARSTTPIAAIRAALDIHGEPGHAAGNFYWIHDLHHMAHAMDNGVMLTGQLGNAGISWTGSPFSHPLRWQLKHLGRRRWLKETRVRLAPPWLYRSWKRLRVNPSRIIADTALNVEFAVRLNLVARAVSDPGEAPPVSAREMRFQFLLPGRSFVGGIHAQIGAATRIEIRDPTGDPRVLSFCMSVPDRVYLEPETRTDRWLIRTAMRDRVPDEVRLNQRMGVQAGDLAIRLRMSADEVEAALTEIEAGTGAHYVNMPRLRAAWRVAREEDTHNAYLESIAILTRGIMAGLFVNKFYH